MSELPNGWAMTTISDITEYLSRGKQPKYASYSSLPVINQRATRWFGIQSEYLKYVDPAQFDRWEPERFIQAGDILWNSTGTGTLGRACLIKPHDLEPPKVVDSHVTIVRPNQAAIDPRFLFSWIQSSEVQESIASLATGATNQIELSRATISSMRIPIAPLKEQKEIANKLDSLLARVDACRDRLDRVPRILKRFRQSILAAAISGKLTEDCREIAVSVEELDLDSNALPTGWEWKLMREVGRIQLGRQRAPKYHSGQHMRPYLLVQNIFEDRIDLSDVMKMDFPPEDFEEYQLVYGDILLNEGQSPEFLGRPAMYRDELPGACFTNTLIRFRAFDIVNRDFALLVFRHYMHCGRFSREGKITTNIAHLSAGRFANIEFPLPPLNEQQEIVHRASTLLSYADRLEVHYQNALRRVDQITSALLSTAFRGELVPQDPNDEPAAVLLERIRVEQLAKPKRVVVNRKPKMPKMTEDSVKEVIRQLPTETFSFDELREKISGDYDSFKDILFTLLSEAEPSLMQVFDQEAEAMRFVRGNK